MKKSKILIVVLIITMIITGMGEFLKTPIKAMASNTVTGGNSSPKKVEILQLTYDGKMANQGGIPFELKEYTGTTKGEYIVPTYEELKSQLDEHFKNMSISIEGVLCKITEMEYYLLDSGKKYSEKEISKGDVYQYTSANSSHGGKNTLDIKTVIKAYEPINGSNPGGGETQNNIKAELEYNEDFKLIVKVQNPSRKEAFYACKFYKENEVKMTSYLPQINDWYKSENNATTHEFTFDRFSGLVDDSVMYKIEFFIANNEAEYNQGKYIFNEFIRISYTKPNSKLTAPTNITWEGEGVVKWDKVNDVSGYEITLLGNAMNHNKYPLDTKIVGYNETSYSWKKFIDSGVEMKGPYYVKIRSWSNNIKDKYHSDWIESPAYEIKSSDSIKSDLSDRLGQIEDASEGEKATVINEAVNAVKTEDQIALKAGMQKNDEVVDNIEKIENYYSTNPVIISCDLFNDVKIVGAKLNASKDAKNITLEIKEESEENIKSLVESGTISQDAVVFDMTLSGMGINSSNLSVPVCITLPIPNSLDPSKLVIIHTHEGNTTKINKNMLRVKDGKVSFVITGFSQFIIDEGADIPSVTPDQNKEWKTTNSVEKKQWKPTTLDELKRFSLVGSELLKYSVNNNSTYDVSISNSVQGPKCFVSFEAVLGDYTIGRTYNIFPNNQQIYSMNEKARITLEIPKTLRKSKRIFKMICVTEGGRPYVLSDMDKDPNTITFETDKYYAFALIYK